MNLERGLRLAATALALGCAPATASALSPTELFAKVSPAVWVVGADHDAAGTGALGSAVQIGPRNLVTACHVVNGATTVRISHRAEPWADGPDRQEDQALPV